MGVYNVVKNLVHCYSEGLFWTKVKRKNLCDESLLIDYNGYQEKLFEMMMKSDDESIYPDAWHALSYSGVDGWSTKAREGQFTMNFKVHDKCPGNWVILNISFKTAFAKQVQLKDEIAEMYTWVRKLCIFLCACNRSCNRRFRIPKALIKS